jgi:Asp-tRNA(Asn)/Glu-tRNA(Gln) amidotransferase A subunit family amidase
MNKEDICFLSACEIFDKIKNQEYSSQKITELVIERIEKINPSINAFCTPTFDLARKMAKEADERVKNNEKLPPLNGIPISLKDLIPLKGVRFTRGSKEFENDIAEIDAVVVIRLKNAGVTILGKTNTPPFGGKGITDNAIFGPTRNPWNLELTSGGSSGGAASSMAAGLGYLAQGSDGGGSIRIPSSLCGIYGIKPTYGRIPQASMRDSGIMGTFACRGPLVRYVRDAALMLDVMAGDDECDRYSLPKPNYSFIEKIDDKPKNLKIGYSMDLGFNEFLHHEIKTTVLEAIDKFHEFNWTTEETKQIKIEKAKRTLQTYWFTNFAYSATERQKENDRVYNRMIEIGRNITVEQLKWADLQRERIYEEINNHFKNYDILITPTLSCTAFPIGLDSPIEIDGKDVRKKPLAWQAYTYPFNLSGHPAASIPCGWSKEGLPIGMQIVGKRLDDLTVLQVSKAFEDLVPWQNKRPLFN